MKSLLPNLISEPSRVSPHTALYGHEGLLMPPPPPFSTHSYTMRRPSFSLCLFVFHFCYLVPRSADPTLSKQSHVTCQSFNQTPESVVAPTDSRPHSNPINNLLRFPRITSNNYNRM